jgi:hypothetical protein
MISSAMITAGLISYYPTLSFEIIAANVTHSPDNIHLAANASIFYHSMSISTVMLSATCYQPIDVKGFHTVPVCITVIQKTC